MEDLYKQQNTRFDELQASKTNYSKDGESRKTREYLQRRLEKIKTIWEEFTFTDNEMKDIHFDNNQTHPYWKERRSVETFYTKYLNQLKEKLQAIPEASTHDDNDLSFKPQANMLQSLRGSTTNNMAILSTTPSNNNMASRSDVNQTTSNSVGISATQTSEKTRKYKTQDVKIRWCYRLMADATQLLEAEDNQDQLQHKLNQLDARVAQIEQLHEELLVDATPDEEATMLYFTEDHYSVLVNNFEILRARITKLLNKPKTIDREKHEIKLRRIEIPHFHGDPLKWASFHDLFRRLIHENDEINDTIKMHQLKTTVLGSAGRLISHLEATGDNYKDAWQTLVSRYQNKRQLASNHINAILNCPIMHSESAIAIKSLHDLLIESLHAIKNLGVLTVSWNYIIIPIIMKKLDNETSRLFEMSITDPREMPTLEEFFSFLERRFQALEATKPKPVSRSSGAPTPQIARVNTYLTQTTRICVLCKQGHDLKDCIKFQQQSTLERSKFIAQQQLCKMCFKQNHHPCPLSIRCLVCKGHHNTLLHSNNQPQRTMLTTKIDGNLKIEPDNKCSITNHLVNQYDQLTSTLLGTALVEILIGKQQPKLLRVLIDPGSQISIITEEASKQIKQPTKKTYVEIGGLNDCEVTTATKLVTFRIQARFSSNFSMEMEALVMPNITRPLPDQHFDSRKWCHLNNLLWADPNYNQPNKIDILLGADYYPNILMNQVVKGNQGEPIAQQTELGWIIFGNTSNNKPSRIKSLVTLTDIDKQLKKFWEIEEIQTKKLMSEEETLCEEHYHKNYCRDKDGRYTVRIPFNQKLPSLGSSKQQALARFIQLERRFQVASEFLKQYRECVEGYYKQGHLIESKQYNNNEYYIPHHAVMKATSTTTKLRVVFDASAKTSNDISLNQIQLVGPKLQEDLMSILLRWRKYKVAYTADIEQMYRQIKIHPEDQQYQKILWRTSPDKIIKSYQLTTVTFGMASAPYLAIKTLQQLAADEEKNYPIAAKIIRSDFYVDDLLSGTNNIEEAQTAQTQLIKLLRSGGFNLRKWASNYSEIVDSVDPDSRAFEPIIFNDESDSVKTLGLIWNPGTDTFEFKVNLNNKNGKMTKRKMLSESSKLFDPLGWLAPTMIRAKILMQTLWISGVTWDQQLPEDIENKCQQYYVTLPTLEEIKIPRWIKFDQTLQGELHGFCDASEVAYAAVIYFYDRSSNKATLLTSKTRVAPIATKLSLPKLELCGASLLVNLMNRVQQDMKFDHPPTYFWTDSMIVIGWVKNKPHKFKTFVANRISEIQKLSSPSQWFYVESSDNPADCASRGIEASKLITHHLWWNGPQVIFEKANQLAPIVIQETADQLELKQRVLGGATVIADNVFDQLYRKYSNFNTIKRVMVYVVRFINKCRKKVVTNQETPTAEEIKKSTQLLIKIAQKQYFKIEIHDLMNQRGISNTSKIKSLTPFLHEDVLRVGGRVQNTTTWSYDEKHPVIIPKNHPIAKLLIQEAHELTMHGGTQLTLAHLRTKYWIIHGRNLTRHLISKCVKCHRFNSKSGTQIMGNLPIVRITPGRPFLRTGVDYAGPLLIRTTKGRGHKAYKGYLSIFVCMTTKAIHIEPVSDLTTDAFIAAYKRFTARRGLCGDLYSDNGSNFVGAKNQLDRELAALLRKSSKEIAQLLANDGTTWHFIPPASPHFGGIWEAAVKSVKKHLIKVIGEATLTFEELSTVTSQVEACLNSRPLAPITADPTDITFLTPGHFLIGAPLRSIPQDDTADTNIHGTSRWKLVEKIKQDFWKRWQSEYLTQLQHRRKWSQEQPNMKIGDLVLIKDENTPPLKWLTGRVMEVHPGVDQKVRVVSLRGPGGLLIKRPIHKLSPLPIENENKNDHTLTQASVNQPLQPTLPLRVQPHREAKQRRVHHIKAVCKKQTTMQLILLILGMMQGLISPAKPEPILNPLPADASIYFYNTGTVNLMALRWKIILNYNLTGYWEDISSLTHYINYLNGTCQSGRDAQNNYNLCDTSLGHFITHQLYEQMQEITSQNALLMSTNKEHVLRKRDIGDTIGYILGDAFGIMTQRDASHIEFQLEKAEHNEKYLLELLRNQTSIIDSTINVFQQDRELNKNQFKSISQQALYLDGMIHKLSTDFDHYHRLQAITTYAMQIMMLMRRIADKQRVIIDVILNAHHGHIHPALLTPEQLKEEINRIQDYVPPTMMIPDGEDDTSLGHIYEMSTVHTRVTGNHILFLIQIPLAYSETYQLFNIVPIPKLDNGQLHIIIRSTEYLVVNLHRERYAPLTSQELQQCVQIKKDGYLCNIAPIYNTQSKQSLCEINMLRHTDKSNDGCITTTLNQTNYWTRLGTNQWIYSVTSPKMVDLICNHQVTTMTLQNSGILTLDAKCTLKTEDVHLSTVEEKTHRINSSFIASIKLQDEDRRPSYSRQQPPTPIRNEISDPDNASLTNKIRNLKGSIAQQKVNEAALPEAMDALSFGHHIHHYVLTYTVLAVGIIIFLIYLYQRRKKQQAVSQDAAPPHRPIPRPRSLYLSARQDVQSRV